MSHPLERPSIQLAQSWSRRRTRGQSIPMVHIQLTSRLDPSSHPRVLEATRRTPPHVSTTCYKCYTASQQPIASSRRVHAWKNAADRPLVLRAGLVLLRPRGPNHRNVRHSIYTRRPGRPCALHASAMKTLRWGEKKLHRATLQTWGMKYANTRDNDVANGGTDPRADPAVSGMCSDASRRHTAFIDASCRRPTI